MMLLLELLFNVSLTCNQVQNLAENVILNDALTNEVVDDILDELAMVSPPGCVVPRIK